MSARYVWDPNKAAANEQKHGVSFVEAVTAFADPLAIIVDDGVHAERAVLVGMSFRTRILVTIFLVTIFIEQDHEVTRLVSARLATRPERRRYEEGE